MVAAALPIRTCVGCRGSSTITPGAASRGRAMPSLIRVVMVSGSGELAVCPGPRGRLAGRGASLHPTLDCLEQAERRRAFARAFRTSGPFDTSAVRSWIEQHQQ